MNKTYDLIVIGAGSGGLAAAKRAASYGAKVAIVEGDKVGGTCVIRGCVPKKLLMYGSNFYDSLGKASGYGISFENKFLNIQTLLKNVRSEVDRLNSLHISFLDKLGIDLYYGWASFKSSNTVSVSLNNNCTEINAQKILIAVGGKPLRPNIVGSELAWVSDDIFNQESLPQRFLVVGGGYIAIEFASILNGLGFSVSSLIRSDNILRGFDIEITATLLSVLRDKGVNVSTKESPLSIENSKGDLITTTNLGRRIESDAVLFATGRIPNINNLNLSLLGVKTENGRICVDNSFRTNIKNIYAIGDVSNNHNLTPVAIEEGRVFSDNLFGSKSRIINYNFVPRAVFSSPEISSVGLSQQEAESVYGKENITIYKSKFRSMSSTLIKGNGICLLKLITHNNTDNIIGCHMLGENSSEIIQMASIAISMGATKLDFDNTMALHPTIAEEFVTMN